MKKNMSKKILSILTITIILSSTLTLNVAFASCPHSSTYPNYNGIVHSYTTTSYHDKQIWRTKPDGTGHYIYVTCKDTTKTDVQEWRNRCTSCHATINMSYENVETVTHLILN